MVIRRKKQAFARRAALGIVIGAAGLLSAALAQTVSTASAPATQPVTNSIGMKFSYIPAGDFMMGFAREEPGWSEDQPQRHVKISKPFYMQTTEVTQKQFAVFIKGNTSAFKGDNQPVERVSWDQAVEYCNLLSAREGKKYRLPTEAEWEYACRAGTTTPYNFGDTISADQVNYDSSFTFGKSVKAPYRAKTVNVGSFKPNAWGLYDMHGNVAEWCSDWEGDYPKGDAVDPQGPTEGTQRVMRGGSYINEPADCRSASRDWYDQDGQRDSRGFRILLEAESR